MYTKNRIIIHTKTLQKNIEVIRSLAPGKQIIFPVKANAYGHGDVLVVNEALRYGVDFFAVANVDEALHLRNNGVFARILCLGEESGEALEAAIDADVELSFSSMDDLRYAVSYASRFNKLVRAHICVDTGMSRLGFLFEDCDELFEYMRGQPYVIFSGLFTHYAMSERDEEFTYMQNERFYDVLKVCELKAFFPELVHVANSAGVENQFVPSWSQAVRPGIALYGYGQAAQKGLFEPIMTVSSFVTHLKRVPAGVGVGYGHSFVTTRPITLATIGLGYADGLPRMCSNKLEFIINNKRYFQRGVISMDLTLVEVDDDVKVGDEVFVFGNKRQARFDADDLALMSDTISYEILTSLGGRYCRVVSED